MSNEHTEHVIELARQRVIEQRQQQAIQVHSQQQARIARERPWLYALFALVIALVLGLLLTPGMPLDQKLLVVMQGVCSQQNNLFLAGLQLPICARCTGIYTTFLSTLGVLFLVGRGRAGGFPPWHLSAALVAFVLIMGLDGLNSLVDDVGHTAVYAPRNDLRTLTGMGMGVAVAVLLMLVFNQSLRRDVDDAQPLLKNWWELGGLLLFYCLLLAAAFGNMDLLYWPLAVLSTVGMIGALYIISVIACGALMGYGNTVLRLSHLARPATIALFLTVGVLAGLSFLRFWLEGQGLAI